MANDIAKLLNSSKSDTDKLNTLWDEYLLTNYDNDDTDFNSDSERSGDAGTDSSTSDEEDSTRRSDYDLVLDRIVVTQDIVGDDDDEKTKAQNFR